MLWKRPITPIIILLFFISMQSIFASITEGQDVRITFKVELAEGGVPLNGTNYVELRVGEGPSRPLYPPVSEVTVSPSQSSGNYSYTISLDSTGSSESERWHTENKTNGIINFGNGSRTLKFIYYHQYKATFKEPNISCGHQCPKDKISIGYKQFGRSMRAKIGESVWVDRETKLIYEKLEADGERWTFSSVKSLKGEVRPNVEKHEFRVNISHKDKDGGGDSPPNGPQIEHQWVSCKGGNITIKRTFPKYFCVEYELSGMKKQIEDPSAPVIKLPEMDGPTDLILYWKKGALLKINASSDGKLLPQCKMELKSKDGQILKTIEGNGAVVLPTGTFNIRVLSPSLPSEGPTFIGLFNKVYRFKGWRDERGNILTTNEISILERDLGREKSLTAKYEATLEPNFTFLVPISGTISFVLVLIALLLSRKPKKYKIVSRVELKPKPPAIGIATSAGPRREKNEDSALAINASLSKAEIFTRILVAISDGMGGHAKGDVASSMCIDGIIKLLAPKLYMNLDELAQILPEAIKEINQEIFFASRSSSESKGMGATIAIAILGDGKMFFANVGDSRIYLYRDGGLKQLTKDHTLAQERADRGEIPRSAVRSHPDRNLLTRVLGYRQEVDVESFLIQIKGGDKVLLCSDGIWAYLTDSEIMGTISALPDPQIAARALVDLALKKGGNDDMTAIVVSL